MASNEVKIGFQLANEILKIKKHSPPVLGIT